MMKSSSSADHRSHAGPEKLMIGRWTANRGSLRLESADSVRTLEPKVMDLLFELASEPGAVFDRERLTTRLWPGVHVTEDSLTRLISKLRSAFGENARQPAVIETVSKRGYRLIAPVKLVRETTAPALTRSRRISITALAIVITAAVFVLSLWLATPGTSADEARLKALADADRERAERGNR